MENSLERIRTIFWCHKVLEIDGLQGVLDSRKELVEKLKQTLDKRYKVADPTYENEEIYDAVVKSFFDKSLWKKYLAGELNPKYSKSGDLFTSESGKQKHPYIVNIIELLFPEVEGFFLKGPFGLLAVFECETSEDALEEYEISFANFAKETGYKKTSFDIRHIGPNIENVECIEYTLEWFDIEIWLKDNNYNYFETLNRFLPDIEMNQKWSKTNEYSLFLHMISAYIETRFLKRIIHTFSNIGGVETGYLSRVTINDYQTGCESGILYLERNYGIDRKLWFNEGLDSSKNNVFEIARKNTLSLGSSIFPELNEFNFDS